MIRRQTVSGPTWVGLPYIWTADAAGRRFAELHVEGGSTSVTYDYTVPDPEVLGADRGVLESWVGSHFVGVVRTRVVSPVVGSREGIRRSRGSSDDRHRRCGVSNLEGRGLTLRVSDSFWSTTGIVMICVVVLTAAFRWYGVGMLIGGFAWYLWSKRPIQTEFTDLEQARMTRIVDAGSPSPKGVD